jgi:hypothetical protein
MINANIEEYLDESQLKAIEDFRVLVNEVGLPSEVIASEKTSILNTYNKCLLNLQNILYYLDQNVRFSTLEMNEIKAEALQDQLNDGRSATAASQLTYLDSRLIDSIDHVNKLEGIKNLIWSYATQCTNVIKLYQK